MTLGYNTEIATREAILAMQRTLDADAEELMKELDALLQ